jgi:hypothetical protein
MFLQLDSAQHINYPKGVKDDTHLNEYGAQIVAQMVMDELEKLNTELTKRKNKIYEFAGFKYNNCFRTFS